MTSRKMPYSKRACARSFEIMGEAVKNISSDFRRKHREIDWKNIAGMRDKLNPPVLWRKLEYLVGRNKKETARPQGSV